METSNKETSEINSSKTGLCPCHSGVDYEKCCKVYHSGLEYPPNAAVLMRSRYSAYALGLADYIISTTHRSNPQYRKDLRSWRNEITGYCNMVLFLNLEIVDFEPGAQKSTVTFKAKLSQNGIPFVMSEKSRFMKAGQRWFYHSGQTRLLESENEGARP